jgi:hypothetical protein
MQVDLALIELPQGGTALRARYEISVAS